MATPTQRRSHRAAWAAVGTAAVASLVGRLLLAREVVSPFIFQDEGGYLGVARLLAGDAPALYGPTYLPGWGALLAPAAAVLEPGALQNAAQVLNAVAAAAVIPVLHVLGLRLARLRPWVSAVAAIAGGVMAASILQATMLLPEALLVLVVALGVLAVQRALESGSLGWAVVAGATVGASYAVHPRSVVAVVAVLLVAGAAWRSDLVSGRTAAALAATTVLVVVVIQVLHGLATDRLYPAGTQPSLAGSPLGAVGEPVGAAVIAAGQSWYLVVATLGLVPLGLVAAVGLGWTERATPRGMAMAYVALGVLGSLTLGTIASYEVGLGTDISRADLPVYGRYLEQWVPVLVVLAPSLRRRWAWPGVLAAAAVSAAIGLALDAVYADDVWRQPIAWHNIASLRVPIELFGRDHVVATGLAAAVAIVVLGAIALSRADGRGWVAPLAVVAGINVFGGVSVVQEWAAPASEAWAARHRLGPVLEERDEAVWVDLDEDLHVYWAYNTQFWHPDVEVAYFEGAPPADAPLVLGAEATPPVEGAELVGTERDGDLGLWAID
jgi:hypothetical protein